MASEAPERPFFANGERYNWYYPHEMVKDNDPLTPIAIRGQIEEQRASWFWFETGVCTYDPSALNGWPLGQMHCPVCGTMVLCGESWHPGYGRNDHQVCEMMDEWAELLMLRDPQKYHLKEAVNMGATAEDLESMFPGADLAPYAEQIEANRLSQLQYQELMSEDDPFA